MIYIIRTDTGTHEFLKNIVILIGAFGRRQAGNAVCTGTGLDLHQLLSNVIEGLIPGYLLERSMPFYQRCGQAFRARNKIHTESALDAQVAVIRYTACFTGNPDDQVCIRIRIEINLAADAALPAGSPGS